MSNPTVTTTPNISTVLRLAKEIQIRSTLEHIGNMAVQHGAENVVNLLNEEDLYNRVLEAKKDTSIELAYQAEVDARVLSMTKFSDLKEPKADNAARLRDYGKALIDHGLDAEIAFNHLKNFTSDVESKLASTSKLNQDVNNDSVLDRPFVAEDFDDLGIGLKEKLSNKVAGFKESREAQKEAEAKAEYKKWGV